MEPSPDSPVSLLLQQWNDGDERAQHELIPLLYQELKRLARSYLRRERMDHTLGATALVNEAYLRLVNQNLDWRGRSHFFGIAAQQMRRILVDHARRRGASKRGGNALRVPLDEEKTPSPGGHADLVALDDALSSLAKTDPRQARLVELKYFAGLSIEETADVLGISPATVRREWTFAKAWLRREIRRAAADADES